MMRNYTDITMVLDRSGSMADICLDTIGGFNTFLQGQKEIAEKATFSLIQFDHEYTPICIGIPIEHVPPLNSKTYVPRGSTALLDAIGQTIVTTGERLSSIKEEERPDKILFVILTDGLENASTKFSESSIRHMIEDQKNTWKWEFLFIGANQDAILTGSNMGIDADSSLTYVADDQGTSDAFDSLYKITRDYRINSSVKAVFSDNDRQRQKTAKRP